MKLNLITEVFNKPSLDGISIEEYGFKTNYSFEIQVKDKLYRYDVTIRKEKEPIDYVSEVSSVFDNINPEAFNKLESILNNYSAACSIYLQANSNYEKTGLRNEFEVYQKLISAVHHYVKSKKPIALEFYGYTSDMDLVYHRMIKMANKTWPEDSYIPIRSDKFIRKEIHELLLNNEDYKYVVSNGSDDIKKSLELAKRQKQKHRSIPPRQPDL